MNIIYLEGKEELLVYVKPLWENTRDYHSRISTYFSSKFSSQSSESRKREFENKPVGGQLLMESKEKSSE
ncbi:MAG TPA: hypothetical protein DEF39_00685 [Hungateiclostridium thermocellum]|jgi:hypothetical protein|uniref:Uncharacterized protein n=2 Tax=Acetivibrio thermocellus TaxID=1515 RepID=G2JCD5_ACET2|nr:hypothetical protein [Acetivibrio thermocellus]ADU73252.1 hypothetical protein Clo1313_0156 [Acetivibrio thermocellus DSM 1313]AEO12457.1 hypothetical protein Cthe_3406 [Acetivibrio thermocellus ATCC 27405]ALX07169.1 hypothetical protein AD2_00158 [Acetivibrio thermocellus AD2]ANV74905.1 hypothetical protein LQRI_0157 [Acetivibrio thermocellus DSM 2360]EIC04365.1 hypothetical protein YSBL_2242 [Acetivibrio thermocellus YS]